MTSEEFYGKQWTGHYVRDQEDYDRYPDPADMSYVEAQICNNISNCGNEIDMVDGTIRLLVQHMLLHWGLLCDQNEISIRIDVSDVEEGVTWIDHPRKSVDFSRLGQHILGMNASVGSNPNAPHWIRFGRGGSMGMKFDLNITEKNYDA